MQNYTRQDKILRSAYFELVLKQHNADCTKIALCKDAVCDTCIVTKHKYTRLLLKNKL